MNIGDVFLRILADDKGFQADVVKKAGVAGDAAGATLGQRMGAAVKANGAKIIGTGLALGLGAMTKGLLELQNVTADFAAETGASADEADRAGKAINAMAGRNIQPLAEVGAALTKVHTDLGLVGDEAERVTEQFLKFARATKQDAAAAVLAFDDILDNWGLTVGDAQGIMDKLIVSHQKFGGSIESSEKTLAALAPALRAANFEIGEAIALLGLFGSKGLDDEVAAAAFSKALTKVKSPEELKELIKDITNTKDPFERATKAADLFGAKAGAKLANALDGVNLDDYTISIEESAGATEKAAAVLDSTFGARFQLLMKGAGAALIGFGSNFGPALTGMASLASLAGSLGGGKLAGGLIGAVKGAWVKVAASSVVMKAAAFAGGKAATAYLAALIVGDRLAGAVSRITKSGPVMGATSKLGTALGSTLGKAMSVAFAAVAIVEVFATYDRIKGELAEQSKSIGESVGKQLVSGTTTELQTSKAALEKGIADLNGVWDAGLFTTDTRKSLETQLAAVEKTLADRAAGIPVAVAEGIAAAAPAVEVAADKVVGMFGTTLTGVKLAAKQTGKDGMLAMAAGISAARAAPLTAFDTLVTMLKTPLTRTQEVARLAGQLTSKALAAGLRSNDPEIRAQALATKQILLARLAELTPASGVIGTKAAAAIAAGLKSKDPEIRAAAAAAKKIVTDKLAETKAPAATAGAKAGTAFVGALKGKLGADIRVTIAAGNIGARTSASGRAHGGPVMAGRPYVVGEHRPELFVPSVDGTILPRVPTPAAAPAAAGAQTTVNVYNPSPEPASTSVSREMRKLAYMGSVS